MKRLYFLSMITLAILVAVLPQNTNAQTPVWDGSYAPWTHGSGTQSDPYLIEHPWHLAWLAHQVNDSAYTYNGQYFRLTTDLDMNSQEWTPIGNSTKFMGNFDGDGHLIDNIYIVVRNSSGTEPESNGFYCGLFGIVNNATINNLEVNTNIVLSGFSGVASLYYPKQSGGLVGMTGGNTILTNCYVNGNVIGVQSGGLVGGVSGTTVIIGCHNNGKVVGQVIDPWGDVINKEGIGGICGAVINGTLTMINCSNSGIIPYSVNDNAGGLIGILDNSSSVTINNSHNDGNVVGDVSSGGLVGRSYGVLTINNSYNTAAISCYENIGGLVGAAQNSLTVSHSYNMGIISSNNAHDCYGGGLVGHNKATTNISHSFNTGSIVLYAPNSSYFNDLFYNAYSGGLVGYSQNNLTFIEQCYNTGVVSGTSQGSAGYGGGIVGYLDGVTGNIKECYNTGNITGKTACGGILGYNYASTSIANCYNTGSLTTSSIVGGIYCYETNYQPVATNCYYLETCGGSSQTGAVAASSTLMKSPSFPYMLNNGVNAFTVDGNPNVNQGYPIFGDMVYTVSTQNATNVGVTLATLHGNYVGGADTVGFQYKENTTGSAWNTVYASIGSPVSYLLTGLQSNTNYVFRFMVLKNGGVYYGEEKTFTTGTCNLTASVSPSSVTLCQGEVVTVTASGQSSLGNQFSYSWNTGETTPTISVLGGGERVVTVSDSNGCTATASVNVTVNPLPNVAINGNTTLCAGASNMLTASGGSSYVWNTASNTPSITVNNGGTYSVTATNSYGCSSSASVSVTSIENVTISGNLNLCQGQSTTLYANGTGTYQWSTGANTPFITVQQAGPYSVTVSGGGCTSNASVTVSVAPNPTPTILGNTVICQNQSTTLTANGGTSYVWSNASTGNNISVSQSGVYTVTATNAEGCSNTANVTVAVNPLPNVNISGNSSFCQGDNVTLTATGANTYAWSNASSNASITVNNAGTYTVTGTDANGCSNTATKTVTVNPTYNIPLTHSICQGESYNFYGQNLTTAGTYTHTLQTVNGCDSMLTLTLTVKALPTPTITGNTTLCEGETTSLTANGGVSYAWNNGSTNNNNSVSQSGVYTVTATNAEGCSNTASVTVTVNPLPTITISGNTTLCAGNSTTLTAAGADSYSWSTGDNTASVSISTFGIYSVTGTSAEGCSNTANVTVLVSQMPVITITGETDICAGESTTLTANGGETYLWSDGTTDNTLTVSMGGIYQVIGYNAAGCSSMADATVNVWQPATSEFTVECPEPCYEWNGESYCQSGDYTQTLQTVHGCDSVVTLHLTITVGIEDHDFAASMTVYPNPTNGIVNVQFTDHNSPITQIHVYDVYGKLLGVNVVGANDHSPIQQATAQIDLSRYANGVYFIKAVTDGNVVAVRKLIKNSKF